MYSTDGCMREFFPLFKHNPYSFKVFSTFSSVSRCSSSLHPVMWILSIHVTPGPVSYLLCRHRYSLVVPAFCSRSASHLHYLYSMVSRTFNCGSLLIVPTPVLKAAIKSTKVKSRGKTVCDVFIVHMVNMDAQTNKQTGAEDIKQSYNQLGTHETHTQLVKIVLKILSAI